MFESVNFTEAALKFGLVEISIIPNTYWALTDHVTCVWDFVIVHQSQLIYTVCKISPELLDAF